jgi:hypothetical protein
VPSQLIKLSFLNCKSHAATNRKKKMNKELARIWNARVMACFKVLFQYLSENTKENHKILQSG